MPWTDKTLHEGVWLNKKYRIQLAGDDTPYVQVWDRITHRWITSTDIDTTLLFYRAALIQMSRVPAHA